MKSNPVVPTSAVSTLKPATDFDGVQAPESWRSEPPRDPDGRIGRGRLGNVDANRAVLNALFDANETGLIVVRNPRESGSSIPPVILVEKTSSGFVASFWDDKTEQKHFHAHRAQLIDGAPEWSGSPGWYKVDPHLPFWINGVASDSKLPVNSRLTMIDGEFRVMDPEMFLGQEVPLHLSPVMRGALIGQLEEKTEGSLGMSGQDYGIISQAQGTFVTLKPGVHSETAVAFLIGADGEFITCLRDGHFSADSAVVSPRNFISISACDRALLAAGLACGVFD